MKREDLRKVEIHLTLDIYSTGLGSSKIGEDETWYEGWFHGWNSEGQLRGIIELEEGEIELVPYECIKFLD